MGWYYVASPNLQLVLQVAKWVGHLQWALLRFLVVDRVLARVLITKRPTRTIFRLF